MNPEVSIEALRQFTIFWSSQREAVKDLISTQSLEMFDSWVVRKNIGFKTGQPIPERKKLQWDLYFLFADREGNCPETEALVASGLTALEVAIGKNKAVQKACSGSSTNLVAAENYTNSPFRLR